MSYAARTTYAAPQMSYVPQATMGGYPGFGAATASPYLDTATITQQEKDATEALTGQANMQLKMLTHQYDTQKAKNQFQQQCDQSLMALEQQKKQQELELNMAKQQRAMAIQQQAASMQAQATQYKLQMEMQQKMSTLYSGAGAGAGAAKGAGAGATKPAAGAGTKTK